LLDPETLRDYSYQHIGTTYEFGQKLIASYYAIAPKENYFMGCSRGGGEAMAAAAIYPDNYDGILAQAPAPEMKAFIARSASQSNLAPVTTQEWDSIYGAYIARCDALDGLVDGVVSSKKACTFDPIQWVSDQNWSPDKQATVKSQYSDLKLADGTLINNKYPMGQYFDLTSLGTAWLRIAKNDWNYDPKTFNLDADWKAIVAMADSVSLDVDPAKLSQFLQKGKKIMVFMGGDDAALSIDATNAYVEKVASAAGASAVNMQTRYFPGVGHCGSTADASLQNGPNQSDMLDSLRKWTEEGVVPSQMIATRLNSDGTVKSTRPLCLAGFYPRYSGSGDVNLAQNFSCVAEGT
jgi:feruloyl esterase